MFPGGRLEVLLLIYWLPKLWSHGVHQNWSVPDDIVHPICCGVRQNWSVPDDVVHPICRGVRQNWFVLEANRSPHLL